MRAKSSFFAAFAAILVSGVAVASAVGPATQPVALWTAADALRA